MWLFLALACSGIVHAPPATAPAGTVLPSDAAVDFSSLEHRVSAMLADSNDVDQRDRLVELRDLMADMRTRDAASQRRVFVHVKRTLVIEERTRTETIAPENFVPLTEEVLEVPVTPTRSPPPVHTPPPMPPTQDAAASASPVAPVPVIDPLVRARRALGDAKYLEAIEALEGADLGVAAAPDLARVRKEAIDGWARTERERAGRDFLAARARPRGEERSTALVSVRDRLASINARFPENSYAADIARNVALVEEALAAPSVGATP